MQFAFPNLGLIFSPGGGGCGEGDENKVENWDCGVVAKMQNSRESRATSQRR